MSELSNVPKSEHLNMDVERIHVSEEYISPEELYDQLIKAIRKYHPSDDISMIEKAYKLARKAHEGQLRKSGEPYIIHPLSVCIILAELELDKETLVAGLLHDVVEDTLYTIEEIEEYFGADVALLVDGVTKLTKLQNNEVFTDQTAGRQEMQANNLRKMFLAMAKDIRVILIKLADRLHNMRTLKHMPPEKQKRIAQETLDIYSPIAQRLGISKVKVELDDLSLKYLKPDVYYELVSKVAQRKGERQAYVDQIAAEVRVHLEEAGIEGEVYGRIKHFFSIYKKMVNQDKTIDQIYDLFAVRILVQSVKDCYAALGVIHEMYKPIPGRFKDYIAMPKSNMYQSLHTTLIGPGGSPFEIQIRTYEMHKAAEYGIAAHWKYKETSDGRKVDTQEQEKLLWLRQILEWQRDMSDNREFMQLLKSDLDLFSDNVYCFTPRGEVKNLPAGSTPIDFAYAIHSAVGNRMVGARVNGKLVQIDYKIQNGDQIEVITSQNSRGPSLDWLNIVKSASTKNKINQWFKKEQKEENIVRGRELIAAYSKTHGLDLTELMVPDYQDYIKKKYGFREWDQVLAAIGHGGLKEGQILNKMLELYDADHPKILTNDEIIQQISSAAPHISKRSKNAIVVKGIHDVAVHFSRCCNPVPGDEIVGFVTRGRGISIHRTDCMNVLNMPEFDRTRLIDADWENGSQTEIEGTFEAEITVYANDRHGLLNDITKAFSDAGMNLLGVNSRTNKQGIASITIAFEIRSKKELQAICDKIRMIRSVVDVTRNNS